MGAEVREEQMSLPGPLSATVMTPIAVQSIVTVLRTDSLYHNGSDTRL